MTLQCDWAPGSFTARPFCFFSIIDVIVVTTLLQFCSQNEGRSGQKRSQALSKMTFSTALLLEQGISIINQGKTMVCVE